MCLYIFAWLLYTYLHVQKISGHLYVKRSCMVNVITMYFVNMTRYPHVLCLVTIPTTVYISTHWYHETIVLTFSCVLRGSGLCLLSM